MIGTIRFTPSISSHRALPNSTTLASRVIPALFTSTSIGPSALTACSKKASTSFSSATLQWPAHARPPGYDRGLELPRRLTRVRGTRCQRPPRARTALSTIARPMPREPPVTTATRPARLNSSRDAADIHGCSRIVREQSAMIRYTAARSVPHAHPQDHAEQRAATGKTVDQHDRSFGAASAMGQAQFRRLGARLHQAGNRRHLPHGSAEECRGARSLPDAPIRRAHL